MVCLGIAITRLRTQADSQRTIEDAEVRFALTLDLPGDKAPPKMAPPAPPSRIQFWVDAGAHSKSIALLVTAF